MSFFALVITDHQNYHNNLHAAQVMIVLTEEKKMKHLKIKLQGKGEVGRVELFEIQFKLFALKGKTLHWIPTFIFECTAC